LGQGMKVMGRWEEARECWELALMVEPSHVIAMGHLAAYYGDAGQVDECIAMFDRILEIQPDQLMAAQSRLFAINLSASWTTEDIFREHISWGQKFSSQLREKPENVPFSLHTIDRHRDRHLRIGMYQ